MKLRTFRAKSMADALTAVKREIGPDALIVHTRSFKVGAVLGMGGHEQVEIVAAPPSVAARTGAATPPPRREPSPAEIAGRLAAAYSAAPPAPPRITRPVAAPPRAESPRAQAPRPEPTRRPAPSIAPEPRPVALPLPETARPVARRVLEPAALPVRNAPARSELEGELSDIKRMVAHLVSAGAPTPRRADPVNAPDEDPLASWYTRLIASAVSRELAQRIIADVRRRLGSDLPDEHTIGRTFREAIAAYVPAAGDSFDSLLPPGLPRPRTIALVGATGVGKTTTIAKLAAQAKLSGAARAAVITCDTQRLGAIEQLRSYADVIGVPFRVAADAHEMEDARRHFADHDLILIDTPGLSPRDSAGVTALVDLLRHASIDETHLALTAAGSEASLLAACRAFAPLRPSRLLFTKLDEAVTYGVILSVADQVRTQLSFVTTGPRFPEEIEPGVASRIAELIAA